MDVAALIVNSIASLVAIIGLLITCYQFTKTMKAQNRATNVSLFDMRMEILACLENGKFTFNRTKAELLFSSNITRKIKEYDSIIREYLRYGKLKREFVDFIKSLRADDTYDEATDFLEMIQEFDSADLDTPQYLQLQEIIRSKSYTAKWLHGVSPLEEETVNYADITEQESRCYNKAETIKKELIAILKQFIEASIQ